MSDEAAALSKLRFDGQDAHDALPNALEHPHSGTM
jgi:hypothetical protein